jgi:AcrR family transcriptional regulator
MNKQPAHTARTRQNLIEAFWSLYCAKRIEKITVKEVCLKAGYNRGTFYEYFSDVYGLLEHLERSLLPGSPDELPPRTLTTDSGEDQPLDAFIKMYERNQKYFTVLLGEHGDPAFLERIKTRMKPIIRSLFSRETRAEAFETEVLLEFVLSAMLGVLTYWFSQERKPPSDKFLSFVYDLMEHGVLHRLEE